MTKFYITALYKFYPFTKSEISAFKESLTKLGSFHGIKGLIIIGKEGINTTFSSPTEESQNIFEAEISQSVKGGDLHIKRSMSYKQIFKFFRVDERSEIVTFERPDIIPEEVDSTHVSPEVWEEMLTNSSDETILIDTRNEYETRIGTFANAIDPKTRTFTQFQEYIRQQQFPKDKKMMIYCTGGIRCEKAAVFLKQEGYKQIFQLDGGILNYIEKFPEGKFKGECFVFDHRVAVDQKLEPSKKYGLCHHCGDPSEVTVNCPECGKDSKVCINCAAAEPARSACSKNCAYRVRMSL